MTNKLYNLIDNLFHDCSHHVKMIYRDLIMETVMRSDNPAKCATHVLNYDYDKQTPFYSNYSIMGISDATNAILTPYIQREYHEAPQNAPGDVATAEWESHKENRNKGRRDDSAEQIRAMYEDYANSKYTDFLFYLHETTKNNNKQ